MKSAWKSKKMIAGLRYPISRQVQHNKIINGLLCIAAKLPTAGLGLIHE